jgi:glutaconate CoA-transferase subunit A
MASKLTTLHDAIERYVVDGCSVVTGTYMEQKIPFAAAHEIIRQGKRDLTLVGPISDILFDQLIGAGCVRKVMAAWVGNVMMGSAYNFRRAAEDGVPRRLELVDYTNFTLALALHAAALGVPFLPTRSTLGTSILRENSNMVAFDSPVGEERLVAVKAIHPDVAIVHACQSDPQGNSLAWGNLGVTADAVAASNHVIVMAEEIVEPESVRRDPNRVLIPGFRVDAVCHVPFGCHPSPVQGYYSRDHERFRDYHQASRTREGFEGWLAEWVLGVANWESYLARVGLGAINGLRPELPIRGHAVPTGA